VKADAERATKFARALAEKEKVANRARPEEEVENKKAARAAQVA
jgi:hypothetical protein